MTSAQPPLVVRIDRAKAAKLRKREKTVRYVGGAVQILFGLLFLGVIASFVIPSIDVVDLGSIVLSFGFAVVISVALIALGVASFVYVAKKDDAYWSAENLPLEAFTVHENGLTLPDLDVGGSFEISWESVKGMSVKYAMIRFRVAPAALPAKYRGQYAFGRMMLDQVPQTISTAMRVLSGGRVS